MRSGKRTANGRGGRYLHLIIVAGMCAGLLIAVNQGTPADSPALEPVETADRYVIGPLYTVFPKPGELDSVISYLMTEEDSVALDENDLGVRRVALRIWGPIWSNLAFLTVVLALACVYLRRKDF